MEPERVEGASARHRRTGSIRMQDLWGIRGRGPRDRGFGFGIRDLGSDRDRGRAFALSNPARGCKVWAANLQFCLIFSG